MNIRFVASFLAICGLAACSAKEPEPTPVYETSREVSTVATVMAVDLEARKITLRGPQGNTITCDVDEQVRNLDQVKPGDSIKMTYVEAAAVEVVKKAERAEDDTVIERAPRGGKPTGKVTHQVSRTAEVVSVDKSTGVIMVRGKDGSLTTVQVRRPERLAAIKIGDFLKITYSEALALSVEPATGEVR